MPKIRAKHNRQKSSGVFYLDQLGLNNDLEAIFEAARLDQKEGRDVLEKLERVVRWHVAEEALAARKRGYRWGIGVTLKHATEKQERNKA